MSDIWKGDGVWSGWRITTDHAASSYGQPVLVSPSGQAYGPGDIESEKHRGKYTQSALSRVLGVTKQAIRDRVKRGTLPPFDEPGIWYEDTIRPYIEK